MMLLVPSEPISVSSPSLFKHIQAALKALWLPPTMTMRLLRTQPGLAVLPVMAASAASRRRFTSAMPSSVHTRS